MKGCIAPYHRDKLSQCARCILGLCVVFVVYISSPLATVYAQKESKLTASDGSANDLFGRSVTFEEEYAVIGAWGDDAFTGSAYVFRRDGTTWIEHQKLTASDGNTADAFGYSVAISEDYTLVSADEDDEKGNDAGSVYVFRREGDTWSEHQKLTASDSDPADFFGVSVALYGGWALIGAIGDDDKGDFAGAAYIFRRDGTHWVQHQKLTASDGDANDAFGYSVAFHGDYFLVGTYGDEENGFRSGAVYVFRREGSTWVEHQKLTASDGDPNDIFGLSVDIHFDYAIIGATGDDDKGNIAGAAYIFHREGTTWVERQKLTARDSVERDEFGYSVSIDRRGAIVGARWDDDNGSFSGSAYLFLREGTTWTQHQKFVASDGDADDYFGYSVALDKDFVLVGAFLDDDKGDLSGSVYAYDIIQVTDVEPTDALTSEQIALLDNYPNPFNGATTIEYVVPTSLTGTLVRLEVHDMLGRLVRTVAARRHLAGHYQVVWDGRDDSGALAPSGAYFFRLAGGGQAAVRTMMLLK